MSDDAFKEFCGNSSIFDVDLLLKSDWPHFTECFQNSLLVWIPCGWLWLALPIYLLYLFHYHQGDPFSVNLLNTTKTFGCVLLSLLGVIELIEEKNSSNASGLQTPHVLYVSVGLKIATFVMLCGLIQIERIKGVITSGVLWTFWFFLAIAGVIPFYSRIYQKEYDESIFRFSLYCLYFVLVLLEFLLHSFAEKLTTGDHHGYQQIGKKTSPELTASFPSRLVYQWINELVLLSYRKGLVEDDLFELHPRDKASLIVPQFQEAWDKEVRHANFLNREREKKEVHKKQFVWYSTKTVPNKHSQDATETTSLLLNGTTLHSRYQDRVDDKKSKKVEASLFKLMTKLYGVDFLISFACKLVYDLLQFVSPMLLDVLIAFTNNKQNETLWKGYLYALSFFVVAVTSSVFFHQNFHISMTLGMRIKTACIAAVYGKALTMSNEARKSSTVGEIVNLMSVDCQRIQDAAGYLWMVWSAPLQIALSLVLLWQQLGVSVLAGVAIMILLIPVNGIIAFKTRQYQMQQMKLKDARLKLMNEVITGIKVLKLYAWEPSFEKKVLDVRNKEIDVLIKSAYLQAFATFAWTCTPFLVSS